MGDRASPDLRRVVDVEHEPIREIGDAFERVERSAAPPYDRRQTRQPQRRDGVVVEAGRESEERDRVVGDPDRRRAFLAFGNENRPDAARLSDAIERGGRVGKPRGLADDGKLLCCDVNEEWAAIARRYFREAGLDSIIDGRERLMGVAREEGDGPGLLRYMDAILTVTPEAAEERWMRAVLRYQNGERAGARADVDWLLAREPDGVPLERVRELQRALER